MIIVPKQNKQANPKRRRRVQHKHNVTLTLGHRKKGCSTDRYQMQLRHYHGDVAFAANCCYPSFSGLAVRELGHNSGAWSECVPVQRCERGNPRAPDLDLQAPWNSARSLERQLARLEALQPGAPPWNQKWTTPQLLRRSELSPQQQYLSR